MRLETNSLSHQPNGALGVTPGRFAWQDKARGKSARRGTRPPAADEMGARAQKVNKRTTRSIDTPNPQQTANHLASSSH
jgi:hypothetical protein